VEIARLTGCKNFVGKTEKFIFSAFVDLKPMQRFENGGDMCGLRSLNNSASKRVLDLLERIKLTVWKDVIERVTVVKFTLYCLYYNTVHDSFCLVIIDRISLHVVLHFE